VKSTVSVDNPEAARLLAEFEKVGRPYAAKSKDAVARVTRWEWTKYRPRVSLTPLEAERSGEEPGKVLAAEPKKKSEVVQSGFDDEGRLLLYRSWPSFGTKPYETFVEYGKDQAVAYRFDLQRKVVGLDRYALRNGRVERHISASKFAVRLERFSYDERGRLDLADYTTWDFQRSSTIRAQDRCKYAAKGELRILRTLAAGGDARVIYDGRRTDVRPLADDFLVTLVRDIEKMVLSAKVRDPICAVALAYDFEGLLPSIGVLLAEEREALAVRFAGQPSHVLWNPAEYSNYDKLHLKGKELKKLADELVSQRTLESAGIDPNALYVEVSRRLARGRLLKEANVTPDFVAFATDYECAALIANLRAANPKNVLQALERRGFLGAKVTLKMKAKAEPAPPKAASKAPARKAARKKAKSKN
jgi:hypothetical protein